MVTVKVAVRVAAGGTANPLVQALALMLELNQY